MSLVVPLGEIFEKETGLLAKHVSWKRIELGDVCRILNGFPFKSALFNTSKGFPVIRIRDIANTSTETYYSGEFPPEYVVKKGDLLIGMDGNFRCCEWCGVEAGLNQRVCKITPDEDFLDRHFLFYGLNGYLKAIENVTSSVTVAHLSSRDIQQIPFPLPPLAEQRRIAAKLEKLLAHTDACQRRLEKLPVLLKRFRQSVLAAACSGRLTADWREENRATEPANALLERITARLGKPLLKCDADDLSFEIPSSWESIQASDLCRPTTIITYGVLKPVWVNNGIPTVRVQDMKQGKILVETVAQCCPDRAKKFSKTTLETGDLLIAKDGATLGKTAFVPSELDGGNITQHVLRFPISRLVESVFVRLIIDSHHGQDWMRTETRGAALPGVNVGDFRRMPIPLPPLSEQQEIVRRVDELFALADQLEQRLTQARKQLDQLPPALLARAFAGKLVPQDPADEPAEKMLQRIRAKAPEPLKKSHAKSKR